MPYHAISTSVSSRTSPDEARAKRGLIRLGLSGLPAATSTDILIPLLKPVIENCAYVPAVPQRQDRAKATAFVVEVNSNDEACSHGRQQWDTSSRALVFRQAGGRE